MRDILLLLILVGSIPFILRRPWIGVLMWCWVSYMIPHRMTWGFMQEFPIAQIIAIVTLVSYLYSKEPKKVPISGPVIWLVIFYLWLFITWAVHDKTPFVNYLAFKVVKIQFFTLIILAMLISRERIEQALWVIAFSIGFFGIKGGLYTIATAGGGRVWGPPGGYFEGNNELGLTLVMTIPIMYYLVSATNKRWLKYVLWGMMALSAAAVLGTQSRGAFLSICACLFFLWFKSDRKFLMAIIFAVSIPFAYQSMPQTWHDRMATIFEENEEDYDGSVQGRLNAWRMAINLANDKIFGGGFNAATPANFQIYAPYPDHFVDFHSIYFQILGKHGWIGLFIYIMMFFSAWWLGFRIKRKCKQEEGLVWAAKLSSMLQVSLIAFGTGGTFLGLGYFDLPFHFLITMVAINTLVDKHLAKKVVTDTPPLRAAPGVTQRV